MQKCISQECQKQIAVQSATLKIIWQLDTQKGAGGRHTVLKDILLCPLALRWEIDPLQSDEAPVWLMPLTVIVTPGSGTRAVGREGHTQQPPRARASSGSTQPLFFSLHAPSPHSLSGCHDKSLYNSGLRSLRYQTNRPQTPCWNEYNNGLRKIAQGSQTQEEKWGCVRVCSLQGEVASRHMSHGEAGAARLFCGWGGNRGCQIGIDMCHSGECQALYLRQQEGHVSVW